MSLETEKKREKQMKIFLSLYIGLSILFIVTVGVLNALT